MKGYITIEAGCVESKKEKPPLVSVIVPIYNAERFLDQALDSIEAQTLNNIEILCINDGSTDGSLAIIQEHAENDERIRIIDKPNGGYGSGCNRGIREAKGTWIAIVEPDDWIDPGMYKDMTDFAGKFSEVIDIVKTPFYSIWLPDTPQQQHLNCSYNLLVKPTRQPFTVDDPGFVEILGHHPSIWSALYRKDFLLENDIWFPEYPGAGWADNPFLIETYIKAKNIVYLPKPYYNYREDTPEQATAFALNHTLLPLERWHTMTDLLDEYGIDDEGVRRAHNGRGFLYLSGIVEEVDLSHDDVREAAIAMFNRMDDDLVFNDPQTSPAWKKKYAELKGIEMPEISRSVYIKGLISKGLFNLRNVGPIRTLQVTRYYFSKHKRRTGQA